MLAANRLMLAVNRLMPVVNRANVYAKQIDARGKPGECLCQTD